MSSSNLTQHPVSSADPPFGCSNIADAAIACRNSLTSCNTISYLWDEWAENRLADFRLWDASIGASSQSGSSLEDRLISTPHIKKVILSLLNVFKVTIDECREFGRRSDQTVSRYESYTPQAARLEDFAYSNKSHETTSSLSLSLVEVIQAADTLLNDLVRLAVMIRKVSTKSHSFEADGSFKQDVLDPTVKHAEWLSKVENDEHALKKEMKKPENQRDATRIKRIEARLPRERHVLKVLKHRLDAAKFAKAGDMHNARRQEDLAKAEVDAWNEKHSLKSSVKPAYTKMPDEEMFFMSLDEPTKQYHKPPSEDSQHIDLSHKRGVVDRRLINLERNLRIATLSEDRQRYEEEKTQKTHERDMLSLKLEIREIELNKVMKDAEKKKHIEQLKEQVTVGERKEAERLLHSRDATPQAS